MVKRIKMTNYTTYINQQDVNNYIDKLHFRTYNRVVDKVLHIFTDISKDELKHIVNNRLKDHFVKLRKIEPYYIKIFSSTPNCWFHDLMDNSHSRTSTELNGSTNNPRFWHIFIGTNNHFAVALPLSDKRASSIRQTLTEFIEKYHPVKLTSDEEPGFVEKTNVKLLTDHNVEMQVITDQNHSSLGIIDRFIRTLRDINVSQNQCSLKHKIYLFLDSSKIYQNMTYQQSIYVQNRQCHQYEKLY